MAKTNRKELSQLSIEQLKEKYIELNKELMKLNMQRASGTPPENPGMIKATRKSIARVHTYIAQQKIKSAQEKKKEVAKKESSSKKSTKTEVKKKR